MAGWLLLRFDGASDSGLEEVPWPMEWRSSSSSYGAWNEARFLHIRPRLWEELVLPTYNGGTGPQKAVDGEAARAAVRSSSGEDPASRSSPMSSSWPPLASTLVQWLQSVTNSSNLVAARVRRVSGLAGENPMNMGHYLYGFLDRIIDGKNPNTFLVWIELYLAKIQNKSRRGQIQVGYDNGNRFPGRANTS
jgi:hypothetical protein